MSVRLPRLSPLAAPALSEPPRLPAESAIPSACPVADHVIGANTDAAYAFRSRPWHQDPSDLCASLDPNGRTPRSPWLHPCKTQDVESSGISRHLPAACTTLRPRTSRERSLSASPRPHPRKTPDVERQTTLFSRKDSGIRVWAPDLERASDSSGWRPNMAQ